MAKKSNSSTKKPREATVSIKGISPYTQGKAYPPDMAKASDETHDSFDERAWRHRSHVGADGFAVIPGMAIHKALIAAAKFRGERIPGEGAKTWTKRFGAGILILEHATIQPLVTHADMQCCVIHVPSDGSPGGSKRVYRRFPIFEEWSAQIKVTVVDGLIDEATFTRHMETAGKFVGIGTHRPSSNSPGTNGRFAVESIEWAELS